MITSRPSSRAELRVRFLRCMVVVVVAFGVLFTQLFHLQILKGRSYRFASENNRLRAERIAPPRGMILDRNGEILADTRAAFDALTIPSELPGEEPDAYYAKVAGLLGMVPERVAEVVAGNSPARWKPRTLKRGLTREEMARLEARRIELPGVYVAPNPIRHYPFRALLGHSLGYMGEINALELASPEFTDYVGNDDLGRAGLEKVWESRLRGVPGGAQVEVDVVGRKLGVLARRAPQPGNNIVLAVDHRLQRAAEEGLGDQVGSVVLLDVRTGDVLAMASRPAYDPNQLVSGITPESWSELISNPYHPLQNRAVRGHYAPASTFKIVMAIAGLDEEMITPRTKIRCEGRMHFANRDFRCWKKTGHGEVDLTQAIAQSCDVYFYELGLKLGVDLIHDYALKLGLGVATGIDLPAEKSGLIPSKAWKHRARNEKWYMGETLSVAIGQGYLLTTPLQLAVMTAAVSHPGGAIMRPRLVTRIEDDEGKLLQKIPDEKIGQLGFRQAHMEVVRDAMRQVVYGEQGTGKRSQVEGLVIAGKTGTGQVVSLKEDGNGEDEEFIAWKHRDHALFVAYAPFDDPQVAVAVVVDHGGSGSSGAAPVAQKVLEAWRDLYLPEVAEAGAVKGIETMAENRRSDTVSNGAGGEGQP